MMKAALKYSAFGIALVLAVQSPADALEKPEPTGTPRAKEEKVRLQTKSETVLASGAIYQRMDDDTTWVIGSGGATAEKTTVVDADGGTSVSLELTPGRQKDKIVRPLLSEALSLGLVSQEMIASNDGLAGHLAQESSLDVSGDGVTAAANSHGETPAGTTFQGNNCVGSENNGSKIAACYYMWRINAVPDTFLVDHYGTAQATGWPKQLRTAETGAVYNGTGRITRWEPDTTYSQGSCVARTLSATANGVGFSSTQTTCKEKLLPKISSFFNIFKARWEALCFGCGTRDPRSANGFHWFQRPAGTQSGFAFHTHHYAS